MKTKILLFFIFISTVVHAQYTKQDLLLGFACSVGGEPSKVVMHVNELIEHRQYDSLVQLLYSKIAAENYLGVIICERYNQLNKIKLTPQDLNRIAIYYRSTAMIPYCEGCSSSAYLVMSKALDKSVLTGFRYQTESWLTSLLKGMNNY